MTIRHQPFKYFVIKLVDSSKARKASTHIYYPLTTIHNFNHHTNCFQVQYDRITFSSLEYSIKAVTMKSTCSRTLATKATGKLNVTWSNGHTLSVQSAMICILEDGDKMAFRSFLQCEYRSGLERDCFKILSNFLYQSTERSFSNQKLCRTLVTANLPKCHGPRAPTMLALHAVDNASGGTRSWLTSLHLFAARFWMSGSARFGSHIIPRQL